MRRIPRPSRAIDPPAPLLSAIRQRVSPLPCPSAVVCRPHLHASSAAFSTNPAKAFLLPGKQNKKKHQQFVRKWQKRLLGDSEPIGAHVDPYDPTSPVRIAPEEQGEYEEVLEEDDADKEAAQYYYVRAEDMDAEKPGQFLMHVGGEKWLQRKLEGDMAKEFEKLTRQTYTPFSLDMANDIETLTGTPYTLRDDNLMMAQTLHELTGRPYTRYDFGLRSKATKSEDIRNRFAQAVAEVYALKEAGLDLDLAKAPNRGVYYTPRWVRQIKLCKTESGEVALVYPQYKSAEQFITIMQSAPAWDSAEAQLVEKLLVHGAADLLDPVLPQEHAPTMDPATPAFKRAAVVTSDPDKKPFDFMSNRPVPRAKPVETERVEEILVAEEPVAEPVETSSSRLRDRALALDMSKRHTDLECRAQQLSDEISTLRRAARNSKSSSGAADGDEVKWRHVPVTDIQVKFALFKRIYQLTGIRISDPHLTSSRTLGDLYGYLCAAAKPQPTSLFSAIHVEGQKAREKLKQIQAEPAQRRKADVGDLLALGNVELRRIKANKTEKRTKVGQYKVNTYALWERGLTHDQNIAPHERPGKHSLGYTSKVPKHVVEGTREVPEYGRPLPSTVANVLAAETKLLAKEAEASQKKEMAR